MSTGFIHTLFTFPALLICINTYAQPAEYKMSRQEYIEAYSERAVREMLANGIPASITLAQGILESGDGNSRLAKYANNHFGIKCHLGWEGPTFIQDDDEKDECFRKYRAPDDSYRDHSEFLKTRERYRSLFLLKISDYKGWAHGLKKAGYATNPKYAELLIKLIENYQLYHFDTIKEIPGSGLNASVPEALTLNVKLRNNVKFVIARKGDTAFKLAKDLNMALWQILKYNDLGKTEDIKPGDIIYLQPKRNKASEYKHTVKKGETMRSVSQLYAIKLKKLYRYNKLTPGASISEGEIINLRRRK